MFGFVKEICSIAGVPYEEISNNIKIYWLKNTLVINNFKKVLSYTGDMVVVSSSNNRLNIEGKDIKISQFSKDELILNGKFEKVYFDKVEK